MPSLYVFSISFLYLSLVCLFILVERGDLMEWLFLSSFGNQVEKRSPEAIQIPFLSLSLGNSILLMNYFPMNEAVQMRERWTGKECYLHLLSLSSFYYLCFFYISFLYGFYLFINIFFLFCKDWT